jgi:hypothetical protein
MLMAPVLFRRFALACAVMLTIVAAPLRAQLLPPPCALLVLRAGPCARRGARLLATSALIHVQVILESHCLPWGAFYLAFHHEVGGCTGDPD